MRRGPVALAVLVPSFLAPVAVAAVLSGVSAGWETTCGVTLAGQALCWRSNDHGQLGSGGADAGAHPNPLPVNTAVSFGAVRANRGHTCALTAAGDAYCLGTQALGALGDGWDPARVVPMRVTGWP